VISAQKQPGCKKRCRLGLFKMASVKKVVKSKGGSQEMAVIDGKNFNNNNSGEFCADS